MRKLLFLFIIFSLIISCVSTDYNSEKNGIFGTFVIESDLTHEISDNNRYVLKTMYEICKIQKKALPVWDFPLRSEIEHKNLKYYFEIEFKNNDFQLYENFSEVYDNDYLISITLTSGSDGGDYISIFISISKLDSYISYSDTVFRCIFILSNMDYNEKIEKIVEYIINSYINKRNIKIDRSYININ